MQLLKFSFGLVVVGCLLGSATADAQQQRTFGRPLQRQAGPQRLPSVADATETAGGITGTERFLRDSRQPGAFVGADQANTRFVGSGAVIETGRVRSAVESLPPAPDRAHQVNRPFAPAGAAQPYAPRLIVNTVTKAESIIQVQQARVELAQVLGRIGAESLEVQVEDRVAYLTGHVRTKHQRELAILLASMQPGISRVVDHISVTNIID